MLVDSQEKNSDEFLNVIENKKNILENIKEVNITFTPHEHFNTLWIMGDFTGWEPKQMHKSKDVFNFNVILIKGFNYYYSFTFRDQMMVDTTAECVINPRNGQLNNIVRLGEHDFDYKNHGDLLHQARKNYSMSQMENQDEVKLLEDFINFSKNYLERTSHLQKKADDNIKRIKKAYQNKLSKLKELDLADHNAICKSLTGRIMRNKEDFFLIKSISMIDNTIKCVKLYDKNGIKVDIDYYTKGRTSMGFNLRDYKKEEGVKILSKKESEEVLNKWKASTSILDITYKVEEGNSQSNSTGIYSSIYIPSYNRRSSIKNFLPVSIVTSHGEVDVNDYELINHADSLVEVRCRDENINVLFTAKEIKSELDSLPTALKIYYSFYKKTINILHLHSLQHEVLTSQFIAKHYARSEEITNTIEEDTKLKIVFKNFKPVKAFYKFDTIKEIKFEEENFKADRFVQVKGDGHLHNYYGKITKIPIHHLVSDANLSAEASDYVLENDRMDICQQHNENLSGFVDLEIFFDPNGNLIESPLKISLPVCMLNFLPWTKEMELEKKFSIAKKTLDSEELNKLKRIIKDVEEFSKSDPINEEDKKNRMATILNYIPQLNDISNFIERNNMWSYLDKLSTVHFQINELQNKYE